MTFLGYHAVFVMLLHLEHDFLSIFNAYHWLECSRRMRSSLNESLKSCSAEIADIAKARLCYFINIHKFSFLMNMEIDQGQSSASTLLISDRHCLWPFGAIVRFAKSKWTDRIICVLAVLSWCHVDQNKPMTHHYTLL